MRPVTNPNEKTFTVQSGGALYTVPPGDSMFEDGVAQHIARKLKNHGVRLQHGGTQIEAPPKDAEPTEPESVAVTRAKKRAGAVPPAPAPVEIPPAPLKSRKSKKAPEPPAVEVSEPEPPAKEE